MERFFVLGCQRTGTTLLRLILETHPDVVCHDESTGYAILQNSVVEDHSAARLVGFKLPRWTEQFRRPILYDAGLEGSCRNFYRGEKILFLQRDPRDTIASMLKLKVGTSSWCENWVPRIIQAKIAAEQEFRNRYAWELSVIEKSTSPLIGWAALYWKYKSDAFNEYLEVGLPVLAVPYEDLVTAPRPVLKSVCRHLGIAFHDNLLHHEKLPHTEVFANGLTVGDTDPRSPIQARSIGQWNRFLSTNDQRLIARITGGPAVEASASIAS